MEALFTNPWIQATCATLVHSLWQGLFLALLAGLFLLLSGKATASLRYNVLAGLLLFFCMAIVATFYLEMRFVETDAGIHHRIPLQNIENAPFVYQNTIQNNYPAEVMAFFNRHTDIVIMVWLVVVTLRCLYMVVGLYGMRILKREKSTEVIGYWSGKLNELAVAAQLKRQVKLLQSIAVKVPMVMGYFKPVIFLPLGMISALPPEQIEAILMHELAHIRRNDFIANLLQCFLEILFFFNPALLWLSWLIRKERENCCDDLAVSATGNTSVYLDALLSSSKYNAVAPPYAIGLNGNGGLLERIKRLAFKKNITLNFSERMIFLMILLLTFSFSMLVLAASPHVYIKSGSPNHLNKNILPALEPKRMPKPVKRLITAEQLIQKYNTKKQPGQYITDTIHADSIHKSIGKQNQIQTKHTLPVSQLSGQAIYGNGEIDTTNAQMIYGRDNKNIVHQPDQQIYGQAIKRRPGSFNVNILKNMLIIFNGKETSFEDVKAKGTGVKDVHIFVDGAEAEKYGDKGKNGVAFITMK